MSRFSSSSAKNFRCRSLGFFCGSVSYEIAWTMDFYYRTSRLRWPRCFSRITDEKGARRFCKKHEIEFPEPKLPTKD